MSNFKLLFQVIALLVVSFGIGIGLWFFRQTNFVAATIIDGNPLSQDSGFTNIAILGIGGQSHEGGDLTDTILVASLRHRDKSVKLISIPRDIWVESQKIKINAAYHYGKLALAETVVGETLGIPIHYSALIDFSGFIKLIDIVGGVDVVVTNTFDDYKYPIPGQENAEPESARYETLHFDAGLVNMDGVTALKYARSRHAQGPEGTDFARGRRQQQIITALKDKIFSSKTLFNISTMTQIANSLSSSIDTNITSDYYRSFFEFGMSFKSQDGVISSVGIEDYLTTPKSLRPYGGAWVLIPNKDLKEYVAKILAE